MHGTRVGGAVRVGAGVANHDHYHHHRHGYGYGPFRQQGLSEQTEVAPGAALRSKVQSRLSRLWTLDQGLITVGARATDDAR